MLMGRGTLEITQNFHLSKNSATREDMKIAVIPANNNSNINSTDDLYISKTNTAQQLTELPKSNDNISL